MIGGLWENYKLLHHVFIYFFADLTLNTQQVTLTAVNPEPCISFTAVADDLGLEGQEILTLSLSGPSNIMFQNVSLTVIIDDGDGMYLHGLTPLIRTPSKNK